MDMGVKLVGMKVMMSVQLCGEEGAPISQG